PAPLGNRTTARLRCLLFFHPTATASIYTLSLHDALPISHSDCSFLDRWIDADDSSERIAYDRQQCIEHKRDDGQASRTCTGIIGDRKSTRLNSSHVAMSYAAFCLKKKSGF